MIKLTIKATEHSNPLYAKPSCNIYVNPQHIVAVYPAWVPTYDVSEEGRKTLQGYEFSGTVVEFCVRDEEGVLTYSVVEDIELILADIGY